MTLIADSAELAAFCTSQAEADFVAVDTEFMRDTTYWPKLCLVQIAGPRRAAPIDTLAAGLDFTPLLDLLADSRITKVFHSARQDLEIFFHLTGGLPKPIFDTQVAAMVCGFGEQVGYDTLARKLTGARVDKASRFADWSRRPLTQKQLDYALADVVHLRAIYEKLVSKLKKNGRIAWLSEEMALLTDPETYRLEPREAWRRLKPRSTEGHYLAILRELAAWRETQAQRHDVPRNRVLRDEQLLDIAARAPATMEDLARTRGLSRDLARGRVGASILDAVRTGLAVSAREYPEAPARLQLPAGLAPVVDLLKVLLKARCEAHGVAQKLVASVSDLEQIAADDKAPVRALKGWRREIFGTDALALKHGRLALTTADKSVKVVELS